MADIALEIVSKQLLEIVGEMSEANVNQLEHFRGRLYQIKGLMKTAKISQSDLVQALENINFSTELAKKLLQ